MCATDKSAVVLVTGARGYLGGRLITYLANRGRAVIGTSRSDAAMPSRWPKGVPLKRLDPLGDILAATATLADVTTVIHLAAANEGRSASEPDSALAETGIGTRRLISAAIDAGVKRFIFLSTIHVYGSPLSGLLSEADRVRPIHPYAITHQVGEAFTLAARDSGRIEGVTVRLSNAIGAPAWKDIDRWTLLGNDLARQAVNTGEIMIRTPGQWRDFIYIEDICKALEQITDAPAAILGDGILNLGSGLTSRVEDIGSRIAQIAELELRRPIARRFSEVSDVISHQPPFALSTDRMHSLGFKPSTIENENKELRELIRLLMRP